MHGQAYVHMSAGTPTFGLWCNTCALPSGMAVSVLFLTERGVSDIGTFRVCRDCCGHDVVEG